jgi:hypothetical protein
VPEITQPRNFGTCEICSMKVLRYRNFLSVYRRRKSLKYRDIAKLTGLSLERVEDIMEGTHVPGPADVLRIQRGLEIQFEPEDFEEYGL